MGLFGRSKKKKDSKGVQTLVELFTTRGILYPSEYMDRAAQELRKEKGFGSRALAGLIAELLACRSGDIRSSLLVAQEVSAIPELIEVVRSVASASETTSAPIDCSFTPEIVGAGKVGWTSGTYSEIKEMAVDTLDILSGVKMKEDVLRQREEAEKDVEALIWTLRNEEDPSAQIKTAYTLGGIGDPRAVEPLIEALGKEIYGVRLHAAEALGKIGDARAIKPLTQALKDEDCSVREKATEALGEIGDARAIKPLTQALKDEDEYVREAAEEALEKLEAKEADMSANPTFSQSMSHRNLTDALDKLSQSNFVKRVHIAPALPEKQLKNAISSMRVPDGSNILVLVDDSLTKSGKAGICVTSNGIYWKKLLTRGNVEFGEIKQLDMNLGFMMAFKINGKEIPLDHFSKEEIQPFADFLHTIAGSE